MSWDEWVEFQERFPALARRFAKKHPRQVPTPPPPTYDTRFGRARRNWTEEEDRILVTHWGENLTRIVKLLDRSPEAVRSRAEKLKLGPPRIALEAVTLRQFAELSGFSTQKIRNAAAALGIRLRHAPAGRLRGRRARSRVYALTPDQTERILALMLEGGFIGRSHSWGVNGKPPACLFCGKTDRPHKANGACSRCYSTEATRRRRRRLRGSDEAGTPHLHQDEEVRCQLLEDEVTGFDHEGGTGSEPAL